MPVPFPNNDTTWAAPGRPMVFKIADRAYVPIATDGVNTPTLTVTEPTTSDQEITLTASAMSTFGTVGNQSSQIYNTFNPDGSAKQTVEQTSGFGPATFTNFGPGADDYMPGTLNAISSDSEVTQQGTTYPPTAVAPPTYTATVMQGAFDSSNTIANSFVSSPSAAVSFQVGNFASTPVLADPPNSPNTKPTFTISGLETVCGATHVATRWKVWQLDVTTFQGATPANDPRSTVVFENGGNLFDTTITTGAGLTSFSFPDDIVAADGNDTLYTVGCQTTWTVGAETFRTPYVLQGWTLSAALVANILAANNNTATNEEVTLDDLFTAEQIATGSDLIVNIEAGAIVGSNTVATPALNILSTSSLGSRTVTVNNNGTIIAAGGVAGTLGASVADLTGGNAFAVTIDTILVNNGTISGGGGGGGAGGQGGEANIQTTLGIGCCLNQTNAQQDGGLSSCTVKYGAGATCTPFVLTNQCGGTTCCDSGCGGKNPGACQSCKRTETITGTAGGNGGVGAGYNQAATNGDPGAAPSSGQSQGGNGGNGGAIATAGTMGQTGANGNVSAGTAGGDPGLPGAATVANGNTITLTNTGDINGAQI